MSKEILSEEILSQNGPFKRTRLILRGFYPEDGILHHGWQGEETIVEKDIIVPTRKYYVREANGTAEDKTG